MASPTYIISRVADPIFAVVIGLSAAALRINREEKEKGKTTQRTVESFKRYVIAIGVDFFYPLTYRSRRLKASTTG
jgi:L-cystine uptake protein TcyP (sodium:dicarboxylate symporter family)